MTSDITSTDQSAIPSPKDDARKRQRTYQPASQQSGVDTSVPEDLSSSEGEGQDPGSLGKRFKEPRTLASFAFAALIVYFVFDRLEIDPGDVWSKLKRANLLLLALAMVTFYSTFVIRAIRWKLMLERVGIDAEHGHPLPALPGMVKIFILSWFANCVVPARLGDAYRSYLLKQHSKTSFGVGLGTILAERLIDLAVMVVMVLGAGVIVFGTQAPDRAEQAALLGAAVMVIGVFGALMLFLLRERLERVIPDRFTHHFQKLHTGIFEILRRPFSYAGIGVLIWIGDGLRVYLVAKSLGVDLTIPESTVVSLLSALVTIVPFTPAGLGYVEAFMIWLLQELNVNAGTAAAIAILDRLATYWSLILIGLPLYFINFRKDIKTDDA
ncbi:MAG: flippase-like domain-containing protein [Chloroflexota bacterium]|nr:flippase-like domain-containing protein [Chloroflexota bacterium]